MHAFVLFLSLVGCSDDPLPQDVTPWEAPPVECPEEMPAAPDLDRADWTPSAPPLGGDVIIFGASASDPDLVYAGSGQNGIWRSRDQGLSWDELDVGIAHIYGQFTVASQDGNCLAFSAGSVYSSHDAGEGFPPVTLTSSFPDIQGLDYLGRRLLMIGSDGTVYAVDDCGTNAVVIGTLPIASGPPPSSAQSHGKISSGVWMGNDGSVVYAMTKGGSLFASTNEGYSWTMNSTNPTWLNVSFRVDANYVWAVSQGTGEYTVQRHASNADVGEAWEDVASVSGTASGAFLTTDGEYLVSSNNGIWSSVGGELSVNVEDEGRGIYSVARVGSSLMAGYRAGVSVSSDDGATWGWTSEEMTDLDISNLHVHPVCGNVVFAGTQCRTGTFKSDDWGQTWARVSGDMHYTMGVDIAPTEPDQIWAVTDDEVYMSKDLGVSWENRYPKGNGVTGAHYHGLGVSPDRPATVLVGSVGSGEYEDDTARIYRTDNHGASWATSNTGLPASTESFQAIHFSATVPGTVLLGTYRAGSGISHAGGGDGIGVFRSTDLGLTWAQLAGTSALSFSHFAECDGHIYAATEQGILLTDDVGETWTTLLAAGADSEMLNVACAGSRVLAIDPTLGVFRSADAGATWEDWTGSIVIELREWQSQLGLELSPDGAIAYVTVPGQGVLLRAWE